MIVPQLRKGDYIYGSFIKPKVTNGYINNTNPADNNVSLGRYVFSLSSILEALAYAKAIQPKWTQYPIKTRLEPVILLHQIIAKKHRYITHLIHRESGCTQIEASYEINETLRFLQYLIDAAPELLSNANFKHHRQINQALGCVVLLTPHVHTFFTSIVFSASALVSGNTMLHKPSKYTMGIGQYVAELWDQCSLMRGVYNMVQGPGSHISPLLIKSDKIDALVFAGSYEKGQQIHKKLPLHIKSHIFCGGKGAAIVLNGVDIEQTAQQIAHSMIRYSGQSPFCISHLFIEKSCAQDLIPALLKLLENLELKSAQKGEELVLGPLISSQARRQYHEQIQKLSQLHTSAIAQKISIPAKGYFVEPTVFLVDSNTTISFTQDIQGPCLLIYTVQNEHEATQLCNKLPFRRSTSIFMAPQYPIKDIISKITCGMVYINQPPSFPIVPTSAHGFASNGYKDGIGMLRNLCKQTTIQFPQKISSNE